MICHENNQENVFLYTWLDGWKVCYLFLFPFYVVNGDTKGNDSFHLPVLLKVNWIISLYSSLQLFKILYYKTYLHKVIYILLVKSIIHTWHNIIISLPQNVEITLSRRSVNRFTYLHRVRSILFLNLCSPQQSNVQNLCQYFASPSSRSCL
jgi:hypothetical protein